MVARGWQEGRLGSEGLMGIEFQSGKMENSEADGGDGCSTT